MSGQLCNIYRSSKKEGMYLYVDKKEDLQRVPEELWRLFGKPEFSMVILIDSNRKLARADAVKVLQEIADKGFYLQMPPTFAGEMSELARKNTKLGQL